SGSDPEPSEAAGPRAAFCGHFRMRWEVRPLEPRPLGPATGVRPRLAEPASGARAVSRARLAPDETRLALLGERGEAFLRVLGREEHREERRFLREARVVGTLQSEVH